MFQADPAHVDWHHQKKMLNDLPSPQRLILAQVRLGWGIEKLNRLIITFSLMHQPIRWFADAVVIDVGLNNLHNPISLIDGNEF